VATATDRRNPSARHEGSFGADAMRYWSVEPSALVADTAQRDSMAVSAGAPLKEPRCFEGILDRAGVAIGEVGDNHHVIEVAGRHAEGSGKLPPYQVAVIEIGTDHQMRVVKLAGD